MKIRTPIRRLIYTALLAAGSAHAVVATGPIESPAAGPVASTAGVRVSDTGAIQSVASVVHFLRRPEGRVAWTLQGDRGPLVIGMPGMGDLRVNWNGFAAALAAKGFRVAVIDLRGQGQSDATFKDVSREAMAQDALALADTLSPGTPVILIGHSYTGASAVWAATERPERVAAEVLLSPFARAVKATFFQKLALKVGLIPPWGASIWASYYKSLFPVRKPADLSVRVEAIRANLKEPGRLASLRALNYTNAAACEARLGRVRRPTLILFGSRDPDFPDPAGEAKLLADRTGGAAALIPDAGHYPHEEDPAGIADRVSEFLATLPAAAAKAIP
jgi:pimeloyl-ACP methyl ester carboxylesterase